MLAVDMRLVYGVFGYGRGHATRALGVLPRLAQQHEIAILAGGSAFDALAPAWRTLRDNAGRIRDLVLGGPTFHAVVAALRDLRPDVVISDAEPYTHLAA